ncbi:hypothetical protein G4Z16_08500 [Streptomyces bathyalis]|uniref:Uncharacterized protein n=1 Tax=Streptomyces bathyalis TaxID=2710756 RepID=A0A7T1WRF1_9ACTN|nr:hypothetical protein [Streptomyces bathyalis]QPP06431.1 hypothetical protein G4Z16_08500 [Streptomyces bathyalis]
MPQVRVLGKGARITGGIFCLLFALHTWIWVLRDFLELDFADTWKVWTGALGPTAAGLTDIPATTADDVGLGLLQIAASFAALTGAWSAGGLLAVTTVLTLAWRLPVIWHAGLHSETSAYYALQGFYDDPSLDAAWSSCIGVVLFCLPLAIVLMAGIRQWTGQPARTAQPYGTPAQAYGQPYGQPFGQGMPPQPPQPLQPPEPLLPSECPQRPTGVHALVAAVFFAVLLIFSVGWSIHAFATAGADYWFRLFTGRGTVFTLLDVSPGWDWLTLIFVGGAACVVAMLRAVSARGFSLGLAIVLLPQAVTVLWGYIQNGFFELGHAAPVVVLLGRLEILITLAGAVTLIVLALRPGVPAQPGPAPVAGGAPPFGAFPAQAPGQPPMQAHAQPYVPQQPGPVPAGPGPAGTGPAGAAYAYPPAQPAGPPPSGPAAATPPGQPPGTPPPPAGPPPSAPPSQGGGDGAPGGTFGPPPAY